MVLISDLATNLRIPTPTSSSLKIVYNDSQNSKECSTYYYMFLYKYRTQLRNSQVEEINRTRYRANEKKLSSSSVIPPFWHLDVFTNPESFRTQSFR
jgi:exonuclease VII large subunit